MSTRNGLGIDEELNLDSDSYVSHFIDNRESHSEEGFNIYQVQAQLGGSPRASKVQEDMEAMVEEGILEREEITGMRKMPDHRYKLNEPQLLGRLAFGEAPDETRAVETDDGGSYSLLRNGREVAKGGPGGIVDSEEYMSDDIAETVVTLGII